MIEWDRASDRGVGGSQEQKCTGHFMYSVPVSSRWTTHRRLACPLASHTGYDGALATSIWCRLNASSCMTVDASRSTKTTEPQTFHHLPVSNALFLPCAGYCWGSSWFWRPSVLLVFQPTLSYLWLITWVEDVPTNQKLWVRLCIHCPARWSCAGCLKVHY